MWLIIIVIVAAFVITWALVYPALVISGRLSRKEEEQRRGEE